MDVGQFDPAAAQQEFMDLLVAQIQYQDPLNPTSQEDITAQLAQISTVSGIDQLNLQFSEMLEMQSVFEGASLVGTNVEYTSPSSSEVKTGEISEARVSNGALQLTVDGESISIGDINAVLAGD